MCVEVFVICLFCLFLQLNLFILVKNQYENNDEFFLFLQLKYGDINLY